MITIATPRNGYAPTIVARNLIYNGSKFQLVNIVHKLVMNSIIYITFARISLASFWALIRPVLTVCLTITHVMLCDTNTVAHALEHLIVAKVWLVQRPRLHPFHVVVHVQINGLEQFEFQTDTEVRALVLDPQWIEDLCGLVYCIARRYWLVSVQQ